MGVGPNQNVLKAYQRDSIHPTQDELLFLCLDADIFWHHSCSDLEVNEYFRSAPQQLLIELSCLAVRPEAHHGPIGYQHGAVKPSVFPAV